MTELRAEPRIVSAVQYDHFVLAELSASIDGMRIRAYLDPHVFVLQKDFACKILEISFNPTPEQVDRLRKFTEVIRNTPLNNAQHILE